MEIVAHYVPACAPDTAEAPEQLELIALGDFDRSNDSVSILASDASLQSLSLPSETRAAELSTLAERRYWGAGMLGTHNRIPVLLWPQSQACRLATAGGNDVVNDGSWLLGVSSRLSRALVLGPRDATSARAISLDLENAEATELDAAALGGLPLHASVSELGNGFLVAGGEAAETGRALATAWLVTPELTTVEAEPLELASPRSRHAALSLPSGSSMLIGGESEQGVALGSVEVVAPEGRATRVLDLLAVPRIAPSALLLGKSRILIGGGYVWSEGATGRVRQPIDSVEFSSTDLAEVTDSPITLAPAALERAFVGLAHGAALAIGGCEIRVADSECLACEGGAGCVSRAVWWIDPQGFAHELEPLPELLGVARPALVPAAEGAPWLIADGVLGRFDPWQARFEVVTINLPTPRATLVAEPRPLSPGAFIWLTAAEGSVDLLGLYHSQRGRFTQDVAPLLVGSGRGVLPLRPPGSEPNGDTSVSYTVAAGLQLSGSAAVASIADTDYTDFTLELTLRAGPPPLLRLVAADATDAGTSFGGLECPWPDIEPGASSASSAQGFVRLGVRRQKDEVRLLLEPQNAATPASAEVEPCRRELPERVGIQIVGTRAGITELSRIEIRRSLD